MDYIATLRLEIADRYEPADRQEYDERMALAQREADQTAEAALRWMLPLMSQSPIGRIQSSGIDLVDFQPGEGSLETLAEIAEREKTEDAEQLKEDWESIP